MTRRLSHAEQLRAAQLRFPVRMKASNLVHVAITHIDTLNDIATGNAGFRAMKDWANNVLTWHYAAVQMGLGVDEMTAQLELTKRLIERFGRTGRVAFDGPDYQLAKRGVDVMDELARQVPRAIAIEAAAWSEANVIASLLLDPASQQAAKVQ